MIRKPPGAERESKAHAAVGKAIEIGGEVGQAARTGGRLLNKGCLIYLGIAMAFGLLVSSTPLWFKALVLALAYGAYRLVKAVVRRLRFEQEDQDRAREMLGRSADPFSGFHGGPGI